MLSELNISNFVAMENVELLFSKGLNVIIGETGAGKSLLLKSIAFLKGEKWKTEKETRVEAVFSVDDEEIIVRREIVSGRSRNFINGMRVPQNVLKEKIAPLITIQSQHQTISLLNQGVQLKILDSFGSLDSLLENYKKLFREFKELEKEYLELKRAVAEKEREIDVLEFQIKELESVEWGEEKEKELSTLVDILSKAEKIKKIHGEARFELYEGEDSVFEKIGRVLRELEDLGIDNLTGELSDIYYRIENFVAILEETLKVPEVEESVDEIADNLFTIKKIKEKYGPTWEDVEKFYKDAKNKFETLLNIDFKLENIEKNLKEKEKKLRESALKLSQERKKVAELFTKKVSNHLKDLELEHAKFDVFFEETDFTLTGTDKVTFMFTGNPSLDLKPIKEVISGGELSRLLLSILAESGRETRVFVFDEIDSGMSGKVLSKVAEKLSKIGKNTQVITVTHAPLVAAKADTVFKVEKDRETGKVEVKRLAKEEIEKEIAFMVSGELTETSLKVAREMFNR